MACFIFCRIFFFLEFIRVDFFFLINNSVRELIKKDMLVPELSLLSFTIIIIYDIYICAGTSVYIILLCDQQQKKLHVIFSSGIQFTC